MSGIGNSTITLQYTHSVTSASSPMGANLSTVVHILYNASATELGVDVEMGLIDPALYLVHTSSSTFKIPLETVRSLPRRPIQSRRSPSPGLLSLR